jgi:hypothetical protein
MSRTGVAVEKLPSREIRRNQIASGSSTNDFSTSPRHFLSPKFRHSSKKASFSTATGLLTTNVILRLVVDFHAGQIMSPAVLISFGMTR